MAAPPRNGGGPRPGGRLEERPGGPPDAGSRELDVGIARLQLLNNVLQATAGDPALRAVVITSIGPELRAAVPDLVPHVDERDGRNDRGGALEQGHAARGMDNRVQAGPPTGRERSGGGAHRSRTPERGSPPEVEGREHHVRGARDPGQHARQQGPPARERRTAHETTPGGEGATVGPRGGTRVRRRAERPWTIESGQQIMK